MMKLVEKSPESYKKIWIRGEAIGTNRGMALGRIIHEALEEDEDTGDAVNDIVLAQLIKYELNDQMTYIDLVVGKEKVPLRIQPDTMKADWSAFRERKTGGGPWTQKIVNENSQLEFYATGIYIKTGKIPKIHLDWMPTKKVEGPDGIERPELTGEVRTFERVVTYVQVLRMMVRMRKAWKKIGELTEEELV